MKLYLLIISICLLVNVAAVVTHQSQTTLFCLGLTVVCWFFVLGLTVASPRR